MDMGSLNSRAGLEALASTAKPNDTAAATSATLVTELRTNTSMAEPEREQVLAAVADMQDYVQSAQYNLQFQLHDDSSRMVVKVTEIATGEVIRQIPSEEALRLAENLSEIRSVLFSGKA